MGKGRGGGVGRKVEKESMGNAGEWGVHTCIVTPFQKRSFRFG